MRVYLLNINIEFNVLSIHSLIGYRRPFYFIKLCSVISNALIHICLGFYSFHCRIRFTCAGDKGRK